MAVRKKLSAKFKPTITTKVPATEQKTEAPMITEVVEEVNEGVDLPKETLDEIKEDAKEIEKAVEKLEQNVIAAEESGTEQRKTHETVDNSFVNRVGGVSETSLEDSEKRRDVVGELFEGKKSGLAPQIQMYENTGSKTLLVWAFIVIGIALLTGGGLALAVRGKLPSVPTLFAKPTPTPTPAPTPTPTPIQPDRAELTIQVLNGGGTPGAGSKMKEVLEEKGYTVSAVGNAEKYIYKESELHVKVSKSSYLMLLTEDLKDAYTIGSSSSTVAEDASYDAQVIVGKE